MSDDAIVAFLRRALDDPDLQQQLERVARVPAGAPAVAETVRIARRAGYRFTDQELAAALAAREAGAGPADLEDRLRDDQLEDVAGGVVVREPVVSMESSLPREREMQGLLAQLNALQESVYARLAGGAKG